MSWYLSLLLLLFTTGAKASAPLAPTGWRLDCTAGQEVQGPRDGWSPVSPCPQGYTGVGIAKLDLLGPHAPPSLHVNDLRCDDAGCKVYCIGTTCQLQSRCCRVTAP